MDQNQAREDIKYIREMIEKTRRETAANSHYFFIWGFTIIAALIGMHVLVYFEQFKYIWVNWLVLCGIGIAITVVLAIKEDRCENVKTYAHQAMKYLGFSAGLAFMFMSFVFPLLFKLYPYGVIPVLCALLCSVLSITMGGILEWNYLKFCGILWLLGSVAMAMIHMHYRSLVFIPLLVVCYLVPGFMLRKKQQKELKEEETRVT
jgi:hypothetical protein